MNMDETREFEAPSIPDTEEGWRRRLSPEQFEVLRNKGTVVNTYIRDIDPAYGMAFDRARHKGVEAIAYRCTVANEGLDITAPVPIVD